MGLNMIPAAVAQAQAQILLRALCLASVLNPQIRKMFDHDDKRYVEEQLILSILDYTILQPEISSRLAYRPNSGLRCQSRSVSLLQRRKHKHPSPLCAI